MTGKNANSSEDPGDQGGVFVCEQKMGQFGQHFDAYLQLPHICSKTEGTIRTEKAGQKRFWEYLNDTGFEGDELGVTNKKAEEYIQHLTNMGRKANTIRTSIAILSMFYREAVRQDWIFKNPFSMVKQPRKAEEPCSVLSVKQIKHLLSSPDLTTYTGFRDRVILELFYSCALRRHEICLVKPADFGDDFRSIRVLGKGQKEAILPVGKMAAHFLRFYIEKVWTTINKTGCEELFLSCYTGKRLNDYQIYRIVKGCGVLAGFKETISPHTFRYSIATHLDEEGVDIRYIQEFLRHDDISTTARYIKQGFHRLQSVHHNTHPREKSD
ncbi:MAG: tyrosine-type recombinase/integrase [Planctomycetes bacterium]|nr:tyrosine-type recombinase/integrase [Planctomycetota bacterium]